MTTEPVLEARAVTRRFVGGDGAMFTVLDGLDLQVRAGEFVAIVGASGCGKSTLLHLLGGLDRPDAGTIHLEGEDFPFHDQAALAARRNGRLGFVFQFHHLLRDFSAVENVMMPLLIGGATPGNARGTAMDALEALGLAHRADARTPVLSGGEQQRVALARAMVRHPAALLADEPTGNLDPPTAAGLHDQLASLARDRQAALVVVTHNRELAARADRVLVLETGRLRDGFQDEMVP